MEAISKLYAEIGFKVDKKGLTEFSNLLSDVQKQIQSFSKNIREIPGLDIKSSGGALQASKREDARKEREEKRKQKEKERENKRFERSLERISNQLVKGLGGLFVFALSAAKKLVGAAADGSAIAMGMKDFSLVTGVDIEDLMQWTSLGAAVGGNAEQVKKMLQSLSSNAAKLRLGEGGAANTFRMLDLEGALESGNLFGTLLGKIRGHTVSESVMSELLSALGLDPALTKKMAYATDKQLERAELLYKLTPSQTEVVRATLFREDITSLGDAVNSFKVKLASAFNDVDPEFINNILKTLENPEFKEALDSFSKLIVGAFKGLMAGLKWLYNKGGELGKVIASQSIAQEKEDISGVKGKEVSGPKALYELTHYFERNIKERYIDEMARKSALRAVSLQNAQREPLTQIMGDIQINVANAKEASVVLGAIQDYIGKPIVTDTTRSLADVTLSGVPTGG